MEVIPTPLPGLLILKPNRFEDPRGFFYESYNRKRFAAAGIDIDFVQDSISFNRRASSCGDFTFRKSPLRKLSSLLR